MLAAWIDLFSSQRRRLAKLVLVFGLVFATLKLWPNWPREVEVEFLLGAAHAQVVELRVTYLQDGQELQGVSFNFPEGAPGAVHHRLTLPAGTFVLRCELRDRAGDGREVTRQVQTPSEGAVRISLGDGDGSSADLRSATHDAT